MPIERELHELPFFLFSGYVSDIECFDKAFAAWALR